MDEHNLLGKVVHSKSGRDKGKYFIIISIIDAEYVYISDGDLRKIEKPKKKKLKHLGFTNLMADEIREAILSDGRISNSKIRKFLKVEDIIEEV